MQTKIITTPKPHRPTQHTKHDTLSTNHMRHDQTNASKPQRTATPATEMITVPHPIPQLFHKQINPTIMNLLIHRSSSSIQNKHC